VFRINKGMLQGFQLWSQLIYRYLEPELGPIFWKTWPLMVLSNWYILPTGAQWCGASYHLFPPEKKLKKIPCEVPTELLSDRFLFWQTPWFHSIFLKGEIPPSPHPSATHPSFEIILYRARPCSRLKALMPPILRKIGGRNRGQIHLPYGWAAASSGMTLSRMGSQLGSLCDGDGWGFVP